MNPHRIWRSASLECGRVCRRVWASERARGMECGCADVVGNIINVCPPPYRCDLLVVQVLLCMCVHVLKIKSSLPPRFLLLPWLLRRRAESEKLTHHITFIFIHLIYTHTQPYKKPAKVDDGKMKTLQKIMPGLGLRRGESQRMCVCVCVCAFIQALGKHHYYSSSRGPTNNSKNLLHTHTHTHTNYKHTQAPPTHNCYSSF